MALSRSGKGKKRAREDSPAHTSSSSSLSPVPSDRPVIKKPKRAETRACPVCDEQIPVRLLAAHSELESQRLDLIIKEVGSVDAITGYLEEGPSSRSRRSALKARKSLSAMNHRSSTPDSIEICVGTIRSIKRRRKQRHIKLREMIRDEEQVGREAWANGDDETVCPVCLQLVRGDQDVLQAHVDACLAHDSSRLQIENQETIHDDGHRDAVRIRATDGANLRGAGFYLRDQNGQDVDDEIDVDGDDEEIFGHAQFTEGDILDTSGDSNNREDRDVEIDGDGENETSRNSMTLRDLITEKKIARRTFSGSGGDAMDTKLLVEVAGVGDQVVDLIATEEQEQRKPSALLASSKGKIKQLESIRISSSTSLLCRICLDPYAEPTTSTGCWHTCCRECWLRCLGLTKLCPICKRITAATDLRRIYL